VSDIVIVALVSTGVSGAVAVIAKIIDVLFSQRKVAADAATLEESVNDKVWTRAQTELARMQKEIDEMRETDKVLIADNAQLKVDNAELKAANATLCRDNAQIRADTITLRTENDQLKTENATLRQDNAEIIAINEELRAENELVMRWSQQLTGQLYGAHIEALPMPKRLGVGVSK